MNQLMRVCATLVLGVLLVQPVSAADQVGKVVTAKTSVYSSGNGGKRTLSAKDPVFFMDRLSTNSTGVGEFIFDDGTKLAIGPSASLTIDKFVQKSPTTFQKFGVNSTKGAFRWISGKSASSAYSVKSPLGTMGFKGTVVDGNVINGRLYMLSLAGKATLCAGSKCQAVSKPGQYISSNGRTVTAPEMVPKDFCKQEKTRRIFLLACNQGLLSSRFRVPINFLRTAKDDRSEGNK